MRNRAEQLVKLLSSLIGSKRWLRAKFLNLMVVLERYGYLELFIMFTANLE